VIATRSCRTSSAATRGSAWRRTRSSSRRSTSRSSAARRARSTSQRAAARGFRDLAIETFGLLARAVLSEWGITRTGDVGTIVFHMIEEDLLQKTADDCRDDFQDVFDFEEALESGFRETLAKVAI
jgi:uncharacterized repeat protein (TIGR04138 family)